MRLDSARAKAAHARDLQIAMFVDIASWLRTLEPRPLEMVKVVTALPDGREEISYAVGEPTLEVPPEYALRLGDAIANYRASLDHIAWELVTSAGVPPNPKQVYFPLTSTRQEFDGQAGRKLPAVDPMIVSVVRRYQPYQYGAKRERHPFAVLDRWAQYDKHRVLHLISGYTTKVDIDVPGFFDNFVVDRAVRNEDVGSMLPGTQLLKLQGRRIDPALDHGVKVHVKGTATVTIEPGIVLEGAISAIDRLLNDLLDELGGVL